MGVWGQLCKPIGWEGVENTPKNQKNLFNSLSLNGLGFLVSFWCPFGVLLVFLGVLWVCGCCFPFPSLILVVWCRKLSVGVGSCVGLGGLWKEAVFFRWEPAGVPCGCGKLVAGFRRVVRPFLFVFVMVLGFVLLLLVGTSAYLFRSLCPVA